MGMCDYVMMGPSLRTPALPNDASRTRTENSTALHPVSIPKHLITTYQALHESVLYLAHRSVRLCLTFFLFNDVSNFAAYMADTIVLSVNKLTSRSMAHDRIWRCFVKNP